MTIQYTKTEHDIVVKLVKKGCTVDEIQTVLITRSYESVRRHCHKHKLPVKGAEPEIDMQKFNQLMRGK